MSQLPLLNLYAVMNFALSNFFIEDMDVQCLSIGTFVDYICNSVDDNPPFITEFLPFTYHT